MVEIKHLLLFLLVLQIVRTQLDENTNLGGNNDIGKLLPGLRSQTSVIQNSSNKNLGLIAPSDIQKMFIEDRQKQKANIQAQNQEKNQNVNITTLLNTMQLQTKKNEQIKQPQTRSILDNWKTLSNSTKTPFKKLTISATKQKPAKNTWKLKLSQLKNKTSISPNIISQTPITYQPTTIQQPISNHNELLGKWSYYFSDESIVPVQITQNQISFTYCNDLIFKYQTNQQLINLQLLSNLTQVCVNQTPTQQEIIANILSLDSFSITSQILSNKLINRLDLYSNNKPKIGLYKGWFKIIDQQLIQY